MPYVNGKTVSPDEAIAQGLCPETGIDLKTVNVRQHADRLWPHIDPQNANHAEAARRKQLLIAYAEQHPSI